MQIYKISSILQPLVAEKQKGKTASSLSLITRLEARSGIAA
jgi:hypothetical protein